jgi:hypothetical protein
MRSSSPVANVEPHHDKAPDSEGHLAYLRLHDDPLRWEAPRMFNRCAELRRLQRFVHDLERRVQRRLDHAMGSGLEEAPFHGEVFFAGATLRFSNFGRMVTVLDSERLDRDSERLLRELYAEHGYVMIPESLLREPYAGRSTTGLSRETWGSRFFGTEPLVM